MKDHTSAAPKPVLLNSYTVVLFLTAGFALVMAASHHFINIPTMQDDHDDNSIVINVMRFLVALEVIIFLFGTIVGVLRAKSSSLARPTTTAMSILLLLWVPIGTGVFFYWLRFVRRREGTGC